MKNQFVDAYFVEYEAHKEAHLPTPENRSLIKQELDWLASLQQVEAASVKRFVDARVFQGLTVEDIRLQAHEDLGSSKVELCPGWDDLLFGTEEVHKCQVDVAIVTVNWCAQFIRFILLDALIRRPKTENRTGYLHRIEDLPIYGNAFGESGLRRASTGKSDEETTFDGSIIPTHSQLGGIHVAQDKVNVIRSVLEESNQAQPGTRPISVYVGDSTTDLAALLSREIDIGIYIRPDDAQRSPSSASTPPETALSRVLGRIGIQKDRHVGEFEPSWRTSRDEDGFSKQVWWARNLGEVQAHVMSKLTSTW